MIGITSIATYIPENRIDNSQRAESLGSTPEQVKDRIGFLQLARLADDQTTLDIAAQAVETLLHKNSINPDLIDVLIVVGQNPDRKIPHISAEIHGRMGLSPSCACFDLGLGCSGFVYGLSVISSFMRANNMRHGVLVTADPYSRIVDPKDKSTALIFGDAATATLLTENPLYELGSFTFGTQGSGADELSCNNSVLFMNGRAVFNFAATIIPENIRETIVKNNLSMDMIDCFVLHQGSRYIVDTITDRLPSDPQKVPFMASEYGNTVSSSIPLMLSQLMDQPKNKHMVLCGFGLGLSWSTTVIKRREKK